MKHEPTLNPPEYDPNLLLDALLKHFSLENDTELSNLLCVSGSIISKLRHRKTQITPALFVCIHEVTGISIKSLRAYMGDFRMHSLISGSKF
jgi:plasmid maintenance system antidote protein VapI